MKFFAFLLSATLLAVTFSCLQKESREQHPAPESAALAAYNHLAAGKFDEYLALVVSADSVTEKYRTGLLEAARQYVARENEENKGIKAVEVASVKTNAKETFAQVFLLLTYGNDIKEEIVVPVVKVGESWYLR